MRFLLILFVLLLTALNPAAAQKPGEVLSPWSPGELDIHHINTGKGDCVYFIFPDGTTMLADAGSSAHKERVTPPRPDGSRRPGEWIARYIRHVAPAGSAPQLDYALPTHFHEDHMGAVSGDLPMSKSGDYRLSGLTEVAEYIPIRKLLDRGWPDYNWPSPLHNRMVDNYRAFLQSQSRKSGMAVERFKPGRNDQIVMVKSPASYRQFEIRNIVANGEVWTGEGTKTRQLFPPLEKVTTQDWPTENMCSIGFFLRYGKFDYFRGGDMPGVPDPGAPEWHDIETPVAKVVGPVDVNVANHHANADTQNAFWVSTLRPRVDVILVWVPSQPNGTALARLLSTRLYPGPRDIFATNLMDATRAVFGPPLNKLKADHGHIVIRVANGGSSYSVFVLDDSAETYRILAVHGPYDSR
jgi:hypothetical protein